MTRPVMSHHYGSFDRVEMSNGDYFKVSVCDHTSPESGQHHKGPIPFVGPDETQMREEGKTDPER